MGFILYLCERNSIFGRDMFQAGVELYNYMDTFFCATVTSSKEFAKTGWIELSYTDYSSRDKATREYNSKMRNAL